VAVKQRGALQQPPEATQPEQAASATSDTQATPDAQPQAQQQQAAGPESGGADSGFSQTLAQQVAQAIQPVLDDFRQQVTQTLQQQTEAISETGQASQAGPSATGAPPPTEESQPAQESQPPRPEAPEREQRPSGKVTQAVQQAVQQVAQQAPVAPSTVTEALRPVLKTVERDGKVWLEAMLVAGLTMLLSDATRAVIQQRGEQGIHTLMQKAFEAAPSGANNQEMKAKTEYALQTILQGSLDAIFAQGTRAAVQSSGQAAIQGSFRGDFSAALSAVVDVLKAIAQALINVIREQWQMLLRLALAIAALAVANALEQS
jgi:hypothetical protein